MCGIAGIISLREVDKDLIGRMKSQIMHRGPDASGIAMLNLEATEENCPDIFLGLAHTRLSIVDLSSSSDQPLMYLGRYTITFNGEIYNYKQLRDELVLRGHVFQTSSDTEVVIAAYVEWGPDCLNRFNGMWAFCLIDTLKNQIFISRDRIGKKPFYFALRDEQSFVFASEIKAILEVLKAPVEYDSKLVDNYIQKGPEEWCEDTVFKGIKRLPPATYIYCKLQNLMSYPKLIKFWELKPNLSDEEFNEAKALEYAKQYYEILKNSVEIRIPDEVNFGITLSGGLDSSCILYLVSEILKTRNSTNIPFTFSSVYKTSEYQYCDESKYIQISVNSVNCRSFSIEPNPAELEVEIETYLRLLDTPPQNTLMSSWFTYRLAKSHGIKVLIEGQGADETQGGYESYLMFYIANMQLFSALKNSIKAWNVAAQKKWIVLGCIFAFAKSILGKNYAVKMVGLLKISSSPYLPLNAVLKNSLVNPLQNLIHYADRGSMGHSIESRMPYLDYRLVEFLASVPSCYKIHKGWTKYLSRIAFSNRLPDEIVWRKEKMGWPAPERQWFDKELRRYSDDEISKYIGINDKKIHYLYKKNFGRYVRLYCLAINKKIFSRSWG
ncbi:asparagine synthase (glutamine-hydrolyzing) [Polynucleobacter difficilis]|uniref:asparagine synthase (glutamine-hydrolyzing) n=1 Tax=Polynucleobacter difficilis TaxID=556054 RepID=UPI000D36AA95|nr:asparagine synthase (glutamine-hydrolyzing) [Polynucleobacter difficilis]